MSQQNKNFSKASSKSQNKSGPSNLSQEVSKAVWYYEEGRHLLFVVDTTSKEYFSSVTNGVYQFNVPLRMLEKSLARMGKCGK